MTVFTQSHSGMSLLPLPKKKKNSKINQRLIEKWNTLGVTKTLLTHPHFVLFASFWRMLQSPPRDHIPSCWLPQIHTWNRMLRYYFFLVTFKTDVSHPPTEKGKESFHSPFLILAAMLNISSHHLLLQVVGSWEKSSLESRQANHTHQW